ncbi:MAG: cytochrome C oxidase subunit IV family protein, partial [Saprospiraceae bacterium]
RVVYGLGLLAVVTLVEVFISLLGKGHIIPGLEKYSIILYIAGFVIAVLSLYKAYFIIYEFMHMKYEVKSLAMSVLLPTALLIWAIIAFFQEGDSWKDRREQIKEKNAQPASEKAPAQQGMVLPEDTYSISKF